MPTPSKTSTALFLLSLLTLTTALPTGAATGPSFPTFTNAANYILVANVTDPSCDLTPSINNYQVTGVHDGAGQAIGVLSSATGRTWYTNGTATEIRYKSGNVLSDGGTPPVPYGFDVPAANTTDSEGRRAIVENVGSGTPGVAVSTFPETTVTLGYNDGQFYACNTTLLYPYGPAIVLYFRDADASTPDGCAEVNLLPQCVFNGTSHAMSENSDCYTDVAGIDWSQY